MAEQTLVFRRTLHLLKFQPEKKVDELFPSDSILIILGDTSRLPGGLRQFLEGGGAALIASDQPMGHTARNALLDVAGVKINESFWNEDLQDKAKLYHELPFCPWMISDDSRFMRQPLTANSGQRLNVATNMPSTLTRDKRVAGIPSFATLPERALLFGVVGDVGQGRIIVLADHSIFIDEMMRPTDNDNVEFTANCLTYLRGSEGKRKNVLFLDNGKIQSTFDVPTKAVPDASLLDLALKRFANGNQALETWQNEVNQLEERNAVNRKLWNVLTDNGMRPVKPRAHAAVRGDDPPAALVRLLSPGHGVALSAGTVAAFLKSRLARTANGWQPPRPAPSGRTDRAEPLGSRPPAGARGLRNGWRRRSRSLSRTCREALRR